jgi:proteasome lid subunit RPN8/RPN11
MANDMLEAIKLEAVAQYPKEACGLVIKSGKGSLTLACKNVAEDPYENFIIDVGDYSAAADQGEVIGVWHTHIERSAMPSDADRVSCGRTGLPWYIVAVSKRDGEFFFSEPEKLMPDGFEMPYLERPYVSGVFDCFGLVRDFYKREFGIEIRDYPRVEADGTMGYSFFADRYAKEGFDTVIGNDYRRGDVLIMQIGSHEPNHLGIYVRDGVMMHHSQGRLSREEVYGGMYLKHTVHHLRHRGVKC